MRDLPQCLLGVSRGSDDMASQLGLTTPVWSGSRKTAHDCEIDFKSPN